MRAIETTKTTEIPNLTDVTTPAISTPPLANQDAFAESLAQVPPTAGHLNELVCDRLSAAGRLDAVVAWERLVRHSHAGLIRALSALVHADGASAKLDRPGSSNADPHCSDSRNADPHRPDSHGPDSHGLDSRRADSRRSTPDGMDLAEMEVCAALAWSPATAQIRLHEADALVRLFPQTLELLGEGRVSLEQARCLAQLTSGIEDDAAQAVEARVLRRMPGKSAAVTRQAIRRAVLRADPDAAAKRYRYERTRRRVELRPEDDGMATLSFYLPADIAQMAMRTLTEMAQRAKRASKDGGDMRTLDQRRADLLPALLTRAPGGDGTSALVPARVSVVVGIETLLGLSHEPGHLDGYGPICADQARRIAHANTARWRFLLTASDGTLVGISENSYSPHAATKHVAQLKYRTCVFPHCAMPAERCDLDHGLAYHQGGKTCIGNLAPLCRRHHNEKSLGHWQLNRHTDDRIQWTSTLTGRSYTTQPTHYTLAA